MAAISTLADSFGGSSVNATLWSTFTGTGTTVTESGGSLNITTTLTSGSVANLQSVANYNLTGSSIYWQIVTDTSTTGNAGVWLSSTNLGAVINTGTGMANTMYLMRSGANLESAWYNSSGSWTGLQDTTFSATTMKWQRIIESGGTISFQYSSNGSSWTTQTTMLTSNFAVTALYVYIEADEVNITWKMANINTTHALGISKPMIIGQSVKRAALW